MAKILGKLEAPVSVSQMAPLKKYDRFRRAYHKDAIRYSVLEPIQPSFEDGTSRPHQITRKKRRSCCRNDLHSFSKSILTIYQIE